MLPLQARLDLGANVMKGYSAFPKAPALLEPYPQIVCVMSRTLVGECLTKLQRSGRCILRYQPTRPRQTSKVLQFRNNIIYLISSLFFCWYQHLLVRDNLKEIICGHQIVGWGIYALKKWKRVKSADYCQCRKLSKLHETNWTNTARNSTNNKKHYKTKCRTSFKEKVNSRNCRIIPLL